ncbi:MAG: phosphoglycerate kinase [Candidatus Omnitrophota bacterium]|nr:phosphoglycerate kinase [Candidatus Omnitrophota bacterium]
MSKMTIQDVDIKGKKVIMRVDFNVPLDKELRITDDRRIREAVPTIRYALENGAKKIILMSHLGRPDGKAVDNLRLNPIAKKLSELLKEPVKKLDDCVGDDIRAQIDSSSERVILLENLRFHAEEEKNDAHFAKQLASLAEVFVNDAFGTAHRAHASTEGVTHYLPSVAGFLLEKEIKYLGGSLEKPVKPFVVILGGAKVSDKIAVIDNLLPKSDAIIIGGGMAYTFLKAKGFAIGLSKLEADKLDIAKQILENARKQNVKILLPVDHVITQKIDDISNVRIVDINIPDGWIAVDIGPLTIQLFEEALKIANTVVWNGPLGVFETEAFSKGTKDIANFIGNLKGVVSVIGGGDTAAAMAKFNLEDKMTHISTGGGASLEYLEGKALPGIAALKDK